MNRYSISMSLRPSGRNTPREADRFEMLTCQNASLDERFAAFDDRPASFDQHIASTEDCPASFDERFRSAMSVLASGPGSPETATFVEAARCWRELARCWYELPKLKRHVAMANSRTVEKPTGSSK
jgi:hypothetical protein